MSALRHVMFWIPGPHHGSQDREDAPPRLPVPTPPPSLHYTVTPVDARGRLADRSPIRALGWLPGQPITITVLQRAVVVTAQAGAADAITGQGHPSGGGLWCHAASLATSDIATVRMSFLSGLFGG
jgi:hypothetical protein